MSFNLHFGLEEFVPTVMYVGMFLVFLASLIWRPTLGIYSFVFTLPMQTARYKLHDFFLGAHFLDILLLGAVLGLILKGQEVIPKTHWTKFLLMLSIFYYFSLWEGSLFISAPLPIWISDDRFSDWKNYVEMFFLALIVASAIKEKQQIRLLLIVMCVSVLLVNRSFYSIMMNRDLSHFSYEVRDAGLLGYAGVNGLAAFEAMFCSFLVGFYVFTKRVFTKIGIALILATCIYCLLFAFSRGGYAGFVVGIITVGILKSRKLLIAAAVIVLGWQALLPTSVQERINMTTADAQAGQQFDSSAQDRLVLWEDALDLFKRNPITGAGFDTYGFMGRVGGYRDTHNYYVKIMAETGVIGLIMYLILLWKLFRSGMALLTAAEDPFWQALGLGFIALIASAIVLNFFGDRWTYQQVDGYLWVLLGCVIRGTTVTSQAQEEIEPETAEQSPTGEVQIAAV